MANKSTSPKVLTYTEKPARKHHEYLGNTDDEKNIVQQFRDLVKFFKDYNGNDDKLFKGSNLKRVEKPVQPGDDEDRYSKWNGQVKNINPKSNRLPDGSGFGFDGTKMKAVGEENINEISARALTNYISMAHFDKSGHAHDIGMYNQTASTDGLTKDEMKERSAANKKHGKRSGGIELALSKLRKKIKDK